MYGARRPPPYGNRYGGRRNPLGGMGGGRPRMRSQSPALYSGEESGNDSYDSLSDFSDTPSSYSGSEGSPSGGHWVRRDAPLPRRPFWRAGGGDRPGRDYGGRPPWMRPPISTTPPPGYGHPALRRRSPGAMGHAGPAGYGRGGDPRDRSPGPMGGWRGAHGGMAPGMGGPGQRFGWQGGWAPRMGGMAPGMRGMAPGMGGMAGGRFGGMAPGGWRPGGWRPGGGRRESPGARMAGGAGFAGGAGGRFGGRSPPRGRMGHRDPRQGGGGPFPDSGEESW